MTSQSTTTTDDDVSMLSVMICNICQELAVEPVQTLCGHLFCKYCLEQIVTTTTNNDNLDRNAQEHDKLKFNCPVCRTKQHTRCLQQSHVLETVIRTRHPQEYSQRLSYVCTERKMNLKVKQYKDSERFQSMRTNVKRLLERLPINQEYSFTEFWDRYLIITSPEHISASPLIRLDQLPYHAVELAYHLIDHCRGKSSDNAYLSRYIVGGKWIVHMDMFHAALQQSLKSLTFQDNSGGAISRERQQDLIRIMALHSLLKIEMAYRCQNDLTSSCLCDEFDMIMPDDLHSMMKKLVRIHDVAWNALWEEREKQLIGDTQTTDTTTTSTSTTTSLNNTPTTEILPDPIALTNERFEIHGLDSQETTKSLEELLSQNPLVLLHTFLKHNWSQEWAPQNVRRQHSRTARTREVSQRRQQQPQPILDENTVTTLDELTTRATAATSATSTTHSTSNASRNNTNPAWYSSNNRIVLRLPQPARTTTTAFSGNQNTSHVVFTDDLLGDVNDL